MENTRRRTSEGTEREREREREKEGFYNVKARSGQKIMKVANENKETRQVNI